MKRILIRSMVTMLILSGVSAAAREIEPRAAFEPSVTREEHEWIRAAADIAATNIPAAVALLEPRRSPRASAALDFAVGNFHFQAGDETEAINAYRQALDKLPRFRAARVNLARIFLLQDQPREAMDLLRGVAEDGQGDADTYLLLGHALLLIDAPLSAETAYRQSLMLRPRDPDALLGIARALLPQDRLGESLAVAGELLMRQPHRIELHSLRANTLLAMDRGEDAAAALEAARRLGLADADMLASLGDLHLNAGRYDDAASCYEAVLATSTPRTDRLLRAIEALIQSGQATIAGRLADHLRSLISDTGTPADQRRLMRFDTELALQRNDTDTAQKKLEGLVQTDPLDGWALLKLAELHRAGDRLEDAIMLCERAARLPETQVDALIAQAQIEVQRERYTQAAHLLASATALRPNERIQRYLEQVQRLARLTAHESP